MPNAVRAGENHPARHATSVADGLRGSTMSGSGTTELHFEPPGPGSWGLDPVHFPRPVTRYFAEVHPEPFGRGTAEFMAFYGSPLAGMFTEYVNGFSYHSMRPVPDEEIPQRFARAEEVWERKVWREQLHDWDETFKPAAISIHRELQSVDADGVVGRRPGRVPHQVSRAPREHDLPAHALHRVGDDAGRRPARAPRLLDRRCAGRRARDVARRRPRVGGRLRRARTA